MFKEAKYKESGFDVDPWKIIMLVFLFILLLLILTGCASSGFTPQSQHQAKLIGVKRLPKFTDMLTMVTRKGDTLYILNRSAYGKRKQWYVGDWYSVQFDSTQSKTFNGKNYHPAKIIHNR